MVGIFIHPLLILPHATIMQKYLHRIPVLYAVFFGAFISICVLVGLGATQGDQIFVQLNGVSVHPGRSDNGDRRTHYRVRYFWVNHHAGHHFNRY